MSVLHGSHACRSKVLSPRQHRRASLPPLRAVAANSNSALDLMMHSQRLAILNHADEELRQLCCTKTTPEEQAKCWEVWKYYHDCRQQAQAGCMQELSVDGQEGDSCHSLNNLERLVYEVAYTGDAEQLYKVLRTQSNMAKRAAAGQSSAPAVAPVCDQQSVLAKAMDLFKQVDSDGKGVIDREEFLSAMTMLQHGLKDSEMELVFSCMDSHGYITAEQFVDIVQAEQICDPACDAEVLRHLAHSRPSWWSDAPHCITDV